MGLLGVAFVAGLVINTTAGLMWRKANMADDDISFNALGYAIPILSLLFLFFFERADITRVEALILALGGCGMVVYFRSDLFELLNIPSWELVGRWLLRLDCPVCDGVHSPPGVPGPRTCYPHQR